MNAKELLAQSKAATAAIMPSTAKGGRKSSIYKEDLFKGLSPKEAKKSRVKLRTWVKQLLTGILNAEGEDLKLLSDQFIKLYKEAYITQDFSLASISSGNTDQATQELYTKALAKVKAFTEDTPKVKTKKDTNKGTK